MLKKLFNLKTILNSTVPDLTTEVKKVIKLIFVKIMKKVSIRLILQNKINPINAHGSIIIRILILTKQFSLSIILIKNNEKT